MPGTLAKMRWRLVSDAEYQCGTGMSYLELLPATYSGINAWLRLQSVSY